MRPTASQAVNIITGLQRSRTRSLSNTSIDGEAKTGRRPNTEERPLDVILRRKTWEMYLKQSHRVPGVCVCGCVWVCVSLLVMQLICDSLHGLLTIFMGALLP